MKLRVLSLICAAMLLSAAAWAQTPTPTPHPPMMELFLNKQVYNPNDIFDISLVLAQPGPARNVLLSIFLDVGGASFFWPLWSQQQYQQAMTLPAESVNLNHVILANLPSYFPTLSATIYAVLWDNNMGQGEVLDQSSVSFQMWAPTPTPQPQFPCRRGSFIVHVRNIPAMDDNNKNELNKTLLFCIRDRNNTNFIGIYHRYLQPEYPEGPWWPTWRLEGGGADCTGEWNIWQSHDLDGDSADFKVEWGPKFVRATHLGTGDTQEFAVENTMGLDNLVGDSRACRDWGWESPARVSYENIQCTESGPPGECD